MLFVELADGTSFDALVDEDDVERELQAWARGHFHFAGERLELAWRSQDEAIAIAPRAFGVTWCLDNDGQVMWSWPDR